MSEYNDWLQRMLAIQKASQEERGYNFDIATKDELVRYIKEHALFMTVELGEFLQELPNFKPWKLYESGMEVDNLKAREELIDVLHFMLNIFIAMGMSADDIYNEYMKKHHENVRRLADTSHYKKDTEARE